MLDIAGTDKLKVKEHRITSSLVEIKCKASLDVTRSAANPKLNYDVISTVISQDKGVDFYQEVPEQPKLRGLTGVFPYISEHSQGYDIVDPDELGNVRLIFPVSYEICPNNDKEIRYYVPRMSDNNDIRSSHAAPYYPETELYVMFIDGNPNKPIIHSALSNSATSDLSMKDNPNRFYQAFGQGSYFGYTSDHRDSSVYGNSIFLMSKHTDGISWIAQNNQPHQIEANELQLDQILATTANRNNLIDGEYQRHLGYSNENVIANHHKIIKPARATEDEMIKRQETITEVPLAEDTGFATYQLSEEERKELMDEENVGLVEGHPTVKLNLFKKDVTIIPSQVGTYLVTGTISLEGDISATDTDENNIYKDVEFTADKKNGFKASARKELANALADIHVEGFDVENATGSLKLKSNLGIYNLVIDKSETLPDGTIIITGSISSNQETVDKNYKGYQFNGDLNLGFKIFLKEQKWYERLAKSALYSFVRTYYWQYFITPEELAAILLTGVTAITVPELLPLAGATAAVIN